MIALLLALGALWMGPAEILCRDGGCWAETDLDGPDVRCDVYDVDDGVTVTVCRKKILTDSSL